MSVDASTFVFPQESVVVCCLVLMYFDTQVDLSFDWTRVLLGMSCCPSWCAAMGVLLCVCCYASAAMCVLTAQRVCSLAVHVLLCVCCGAYAAARVLLCMCCCACVDLCGEDRRLHWI